MSTVFNFTFVPWFRSVAPYIHTHRGKTFVVGLVGEAIAAGKLAAIATDLALIQSMGVKVVLVHGFRPQVNEQLQIKGQPAHYSHGQRITDAVALDCAQEAAGQLRFEIEATRIASLALSISLSRKMMMRCHVSSARAYCLSRTSAVA